MQAEQRALRWINLVVGAVIDQYNLIVRAIFPGQTVRAVDSRFPRRGSTSNPSCSKAGVVGVLRQQIYRSERRPL